jgi:hypothetical protein
MNDLGGYDSLTAEDRLALMALNTEYAWRADHPHEHGDKVPELFTDDAEWVLPAGHPSGTVRGRAAMVEYWKGRLDPVGFPYVARRLISNMRFVLDGPGRARGWISFTEYGAKLDAPKPATPVIIGDWVDAYIKGADSKWRIQSRKVDIKFGGLPASFTGAARE